MRVEDATFVDSHRNKKMDAVDVPTTCLDYEAVNFFVRLLFNHPAAIQI